MVKIINWRHEAVYDSYCLNTSHCSVFFNHLSDKLHDFEIDHSRKSSICADFFTMLLSPKNHCKFHIHFAHKFRKAYTCQPRFKPTSFLRNYLLTLCVCLAYTSIFVSFLIQKAFKSVQMSGAYYFSSLGPVVCITTKINIAPNYQLCKMITLNTTFNY